MSNQHDAVWRDKPMASGLWVEKWPKPNNSTFTHEIRVRGENVYRIVGAGALEPVRSYPGARWYGPLPQDGGDGD